MRLGKRNKNANLLKTAVSVFDLSCPACLFHYVSGHSIAPYTAHQISNYLCIGGKVSSRPKVEGTLGKIEYRD